MEPLVAAPVFNHLNHAHCETGVTSNLLRHYGIEISEPMAFGIGAGLFFGHLPFLKVSGVPGTTFRIWPGAVVKRVARRLGVEMHTEKFRTPQKAMAALDRVLAGGTPVGILCSVYYLPYLPEAFRFHFNAHNVVVYGREGNDYLVSDPVMETTTRIASEDLAKARFAKGTPEPRGYMYYITGTPPRGVDVAKGIQQGIRQACFFLLKPPGPWFGVKAIGLLANKIEQYPKKLTPRKAALYLGNVIRMQEEIGTGGGGFRYLYAAFLQEAGALLHMDELSRMSEALTAIGDEWRSFAYNAARVVKQRETGVVSYAELAAMLREICAHEKAFFKKLSAVKFGG